jgi:hypothetical protein
MLHKNNKRRCRFLLLLLLFHYCYAPRRYCLFFFLFFSSFLSGYPFYLLLADAALFHRRSVRLSLSCLAPCVTLPLMMMLMMSTGLAHSHALLRRATADDIISYANHFAIVRRGVA